jgi:hypothetical protein
LDVNGIAVATEHGLRNDGREDTSGGACRLTRAKAIRAKCLDCCCYQPKEVRLCTGTDCALWPYRRGRGYEEPPRGNLNPDSDFDSEMEMD